MYKKKILIIESDEHIANAMREILELEGFLVEVAEGGIEGLEKIKQNRYDLVISDYLMPAMNGVELYFKIQTLNQDLAKRTIFILGVTNDFDFLKDCLRSCVSFILLSTNRCHLSH